MRIGFAWVSGSGLVKQVSNVGSRVLQGFRGVGDRYPQDSSINGFRAAGFWKGLVLRA